jgi:NTE family protein
MPILMPKSSTDPLLDLSVSDGGLYDNLGLQPVERYGTVLVSDGGAPFFASAPKDAVALMKAYLGILSKQAGALRKRLLIAQYKQGVRKGAYWGVGGAVQRYDETFKDGYCKDLATNTIATIRTDLDAFSEAEIAVLANHGYLLADAAIQVHANHLIARPIERRIPYLEWMEVDRVQEALKDSSQIRWLGRR